MKIFNFIILFFCIFAPFSLYAKEKITVGINQDKPLVFTDRDGKVKGVYIDVLNYIAEKEKWDIHYQNGTWAECLEWLKNGNIDLIIDIAYTPTRARFYDYSLETFITDWGQVYIKRNSSIQSILDLMDKKIAVMKKDVYYNTFKVIDEHFKTNLTFVEVDDYKTVLLLIDKGEVDAGIVPRFYGEYNESKSKIEKTLINFSPVELRFAVLKGENNHIIRAIDKHLKELKSHKNSIYYKSLDLWLEGVNKVVFPPWLNPQWLLITVIGSLIIFIGIYILLRWQIQVKTDVLKETISEKERIESELRIAHEIQMSMVPGIFPSFSETSGFDVYAQLEPAREVGGDLYDFFFIDEKNLCFLIGDVSGKGIPAALFMAVVKTLIKAIITRVPCPKTRTENVCVQPHVVLTEVNREISVNNDSCTFVTVFMGILNVNTGKMFYTNAGHNPPLIIHKGKEVQFLTGKGNTVIGADEDSVFTSDELQLEPGDTIFLYTDGVTESSNESEEMFSEERLQHEVSLHRHETAQKLVSAVSKKIKKFSSQTLQFDDITIMALRFCKRKKTDE